MLSTIALVVAGLSTSHKIGARGRRRRVHHLRARLVVRAAAANPNFPGKHIGLFVTVSASLLRRDARARCSSSGRGERSRRGKRQQSSRPRRPPRPRRRPRRSRRPRQATGDPAAGKAVFASAGCAGCHTLKAAGSTGTVGPNLDELKPARRIVKNQVIDGGGPMPAFESQLSRDADPERRRVRVRVDALLDGAAKTAP